MPRPFLASFLLLLLAALAYLAGNASTPLFDRDEPRYAITSRNMLSSGDYVVPRQYDNPRFAKPPLIYWLQSAAMHLTGNRTGEFAPRLPSAVAMWLTVLLLLLFLFKNTDPLTALLSASIFAFSGLTLFLAKLAITDAVLLAPTALCLACTYRLWRGDRSLLTFLTLGLALGLASLTKGPITLALLLATAAALFALSRFDRKFKPLASHTTFDFPPARTPQTLPTWLKATLALLIVLAITLPWLILVEQRAGGFLSKALGHDIVERSTRGVDGQARPPGFYALTLFGTFFPWSLFLPTALLYAFKHRHKPLTRFCLAATLGPWLLFESVTSKMVHWFLPVFLPLSILTGDAIVQCYRNKFPHLTDKPFRPISIAWATLVLLLGLVPWTLVFLPTHIPWWTAAILTLWALAMSGTSLLFLLRAQLPLAVANMAVFMGLLFPLAFLAVFPYWSFARLGKSLGTELRTTAPNLPVGSAVMVGYQEPTLAWYQGGTLREAPRSVLLSPPDTLQYATIRDDEWQRLPEDARSRWQILSTHKGIAYANSPAPITVHLIRRTDLSPN